jgi:hypothetical protein
MKLYQGHLLILFVLFTVAWANSASAPGRSNLLESPAVNYLLQSFLDTVSQWDGAEYAGGPFEEDDYFQEEISDDDGERRYRFRCRYDSIEYGFADSIDIVIHPGLSETARQSLIQAKQYLEECAEPKMRNIVSTLDVKKTTEDIFTQVIAYDHGQISRCNGERYCRFYNYTEIDPNTLQIVLYREHSNEVLSQMLNTRQSGFSIMLENGAVKTSISNPVRK